MNFSYKIYYEVLSPIAHNQSKARDMMISAQTPVRALDIFHNNLQNNKPNLRPKDYAIISMVQWYKNEVGKRETIEAAIDLPVTPNPDVVTKPVRQPVVQDEMPLDDQRTKDFYED